MRYFELLKQLDDAFWEYDEKVKQIEANYPEDRLRESEYRERKSRLLKVGEKLKQKVQFLFDELDIEIQKIRKKQPYFDKNLILQKREIFPKWFIFGRIKIEHNLLKEKYIPRILPFPLNNSVYSYDEEKIKFLYLYILRVLQISPLNKIELILIDTKKIGQGFNFLRPIFNNNFIYKQKVLTTIEEIKDGIKDLSLYIEYILQKQLSGYKNFTEYNQKNSKSLLPLKVLIINGYPEQFENESLFHLDRIIKFGGIAGINSFIFLDKIDEKNETLKKYEKNILKYSKNLDEIGQEYEFRSLKPTLSFDFLPKKEDIRNFLNQINEAYKKTSTIKGEIDAFWNESEFYSKSSREGVSIPVGWDKNEDVVYFEFGYDYSEHHTLIGGRSGSGKSNLVNIIIQNLAFFYSPDEIELFLLDYKEGVEFNSYTNPLLNHTSLIAINSNVSYGVTFLEYIISEKDRRSELFKKANVKDFKEYRKNHKLSRIVIIIDEFQTLFTTKEKDKVEKMFAEILRKGRSFGIHLILSTQTLSGVDITSLNQLKSQIGNRFALAMGEDDSRNFLSMTNEEATRLKGKPEGIFNNNAGNVSGNKKIFIPYASRENLNYLLDKVSKTSQKNQNKIYDGEKAIPLPQKEYFENSNFEIILGKEQDFLESDFKIKFNAEFGNNLLIVGKNKDFKQKLIELLLLNLTQKNINLIYINSDIDINVDIESFDIEKIDEIKDNSFVVIDNFDSLTKLHPKTNTFNLGNNEISLADKFKELVENGFRKKIFFILFIENYKRLKMNLGDFFNNFDYRVGYYLNSVNLSTLRGVTDMIMLPPAIADKGVFINDAEDKIVEFKFFKG